MANEIIMAVVGLLCTLVSSIVTFVLTRKKYNTEVDSQQIQNMRESFEVYKEMNRSIIDSQNKRIEALERENEGLRQQLDQLQGQLSRFLVNELHITKTSNKSKK